jgi:translocation and assembly module TamB
MTLHDLFVSDRKGVVATIPTVEIDWHPGSLLRNKVAADRVEAGLVTVLRRPEIVPTPGPLLPDIDIFIGRFAVRQIVLEAPVTARREVIALSGSADIASGRAKVTTDVTASGGDRLRLKLDVVPSADRFVIDAHLAAPPGGVVDGITRLGKPLAVDIGGAGTWQTWNGKATATLGGSPLLDLGLAAKAGRFTATGIARPGLASPSAARLTDPGLTIAATATAAKRTLDTDIRLSSPALELAARGKLDLGAGRYNSVRIDTRLLKPGAAFAGVTGRDVRAALTLDGPFATPTVDYAVTAAALGFGTTGVESLRATGIATIDATRIRLPLHANARRVTGVDAAVGGLLDNVRIDGDISVTAKQIASDNLRLRSSQIDATVVAALTLATGEYTATLKGGINRYVVAGLGIVDLVTDARLVPAGRGQVALRSNIRATTVQIDNASARDFLGGNAVATAVVERSPAGLFGIGSLRVVASKFRITDGRGTYRSDGRIALTAAGNQSQYGPFTLDASGTVAKPVVVLRAKHPNVGIALSDVVATLRPALGGYAITATGGSAYGPFAVDAGLRTGRGPLTIDVRRASLAGLIVNGTIAATPAEPYAGTLALTGADRQRPPRRNRIGPARRPRTYRRQRAHPASGAAADRAGVGDRDCDAVSECAAGQRIGDLHRGPPGHAAHRPCNSEGRLSRRHRAGRGRRRRHQRRAVYARRQCRTVPGDHPHRWARHDRRGRASPRRRRRDRQGARRLPVAAGDDRAAERADRRLGQQRRDDQPRRTTRRGRSRAGGGVQARTRPRRQGVGNGHRVASRRRRAGGER